MANNIYPLAREAFLSGAIDWTAGTIKAALIDKGTYTYSAAHQYWSSAVASVIGTPTALTTRTATLGVADADDVTFTGVSGATVEALIIYKDTGSNSTSPLIAFIDDVSAGLPFTPNGGNVTVTWDSGSSRIFRL